MKVAGTYTLNAPREQVWQLLNDPAFLKACLPGCESLEAAGPDQYQVVLTMGLAAVKGRYTGSVTLSDKQPPDHLKLQVQGRGTPGFMQGTGTLDLTEVPEGTRVAYEGDVQVGGPIAGVGQRLLDGAAKMVVGQFFTGVRAQLEASPSPPPPDPQGAAASTLASSAPTAAATPLQLSPWRLLLRFVWTECRDRVRHWYARLAG